MTARARAVALRAGSPLCTGRRRTMRRRRRACRQGRGQAGRCCTSPSRARRRCSSAAGRQVFSSRCVEGAFYALDNNNPEPRRRMDFHAPTRSFASRFFVTGLASSPGPPVAGPVCIALAASGAGSSFDPDGRCRGPRLRGATVKKSPQVSTTFARPTSRWARPCPWWRCCPVRRQWTCETSARTLCRRPPGTDRYVQSGRTRHFSTLVDSNSCKRQTAMYGPRPAERGSPSRESERPGTNEAHRPRHPQLDDRNDLDDGERSPQPRPNRSLATVTTSLSRTGA